MARKDDRISVKFDREISEEVLEKAKERCLEQFGKLQGRYSEFLLWCIEYALEEIKNNPEITKEINGLAKKPLKDVTHVTHSNGKRCHPCHPSSGGKE